MKEQFSTIDGLFDEAEVGKAHKFRMKYDLGFVCPTIVFLDCQKEWPRRTYPLASATTGHGVQQNPSQRAGSDYITHRWGIGGSKVTNSGKYIASEFGWVIGERAEVRLNPTDIRAIHVFAGPEPSDEHGLQFGDFIDEAEDPGRTGLNRAKVAEEAKTHARGADREGRSHSREVKKQLRPEHAARGRACRARCRLHPRATTHGTPGLAEDAVAAGVV